MNNWSLKLLNLGRIAFSMDKYVSKKSSSSGSSGADTACEKFKFFWRKESPFSQHHPCIFTIDGITYNCAEQYMMHQKAVMFNDNVMAEKIMTTDKPQVQKSCGRKVKDFNAARWTSACKDVVWRANLAKFRQNAALKRNLFATAGTMMVEASPKDRRWGIGLSESNKKALDRRTWRGQNWLGEILTGVREQLLLEENPDIFFEGEDVVEDCSLSTTASTTQDALTKSVDESLYKTGTGPRAAYASNSNIAASKEVHNEEGKKELLKDSSRISHTNPGTQSVVKSTLIHPVERTPVKRKAKRELEKNVKKRPL